MKNKTISATRRKVANMLTDVEAAAYLGLSLPILRSDRIKGHLGIPYYKIGKLCRYDPTELDQWLVKTMASGRRIGKNNAPPTDDANTVA